MDTPRESSHEPSGHAAPRAENASALTSPRRSTKRRRFVRALIAALLVVALLTGIWGYLRPVARTVYVSMPVSRGTVAPYIVASGSVNPVVTVQVGTYVSGVIQELHCDYNTRVKAGQLCARIDPRPYQVIVDQNRAALAAARAQLAKDQANLVYARAAWNRQARLVTEHLTSQDAADAARSAYQQVRAQVDLDAATVTQREADLHAADVNLGYTRITSPVDGIVVTRNITQGQTVAASFQTPTLFLIATDLTQMQVDANVSESDIGQVKDGDAATFTVEAFPGRIFRGRVIQVRQSPQTIQNVVTYDVVVAASNPQLLLKPGMTADVRVVTADIPATLRVPLQALRYWPEAVPKPQEERLGGQNVWILRAGRPVAVPVVVGVSDDSFAQIKSGAIAPGEPVIIAERHTGDNQNAAGTTPRRRPPFM